MRRATGLRFLVVLAGFCLALSCLVHAEDHPRRGRKYKAPPPSSTITVTVLKKDNGKPIQNAAVIFHPVENGRDLGGMELKTNEDGKATMDVIPTGDTVLLQIIAPGFQTYGGTYKIDKPTMAMTLHLSRPVQQYSTYQHQGAGAENSGSKNSGNRNKKSGESGAKQ